MGYWLSIFIVIVVGSLVIDNWFDTLLQKIPYYIGLVVIVIALIIWGVMDWKKHTIYDYKMGNNYLVLYYLTGKTEHIAYQDIENIKIFMEGKSGNRCGLSFYIKEKNNIRTLSDIRCDSVKDLRDQINRQR